MLQVDAFADAVFSGNPAAVCPLAEWLPDDVMQAIAAENNLPETAFLVPDGDGFHLRWFTPTTEVELCGHATLAAAFVVLADSGGDAVRFRTRGGELGVTRRGGLLHLDLPAQEARAAAAPAALAEGLGVSGFAALVGPNHMAVLDRQEQVAALDPDFRRLADLHPRGVIATAPGDGCDFVSRYFAPSYGIDEDPVTGSAHCMLVPYWSARLGRRRLVARQISRRGGTLHCEDRGARVGVGGRAALYMEGVIRV